MKNKVDTKVDVVPKGGGFYISVVTEKGDWLAITHEGVSLNRELLAKGKLKIVKNASK